MVKIRPRPSRAALLLATVLLPLAAAADAPAVAATGSVVSQYVFRGLRLNAAGFQPSVDVTAGAAVFGVWANVPLRDRVRDRSDPEIQLYGAYTLPLTEKLSLVPGATSYHFPHAPTDAGFYRTTFEPNFALNYTTNGWRIAPKLYYDAVLKGPTAELSAFYAYPLGKLGSELDFTATVGTYRWNEFAKDAAPAVKAWGDYWLLGVAAPFQLTRESKVTLGFAYTEGRNAFTKAGRLGKRPNPLASGRGVVTVSYAWSF